MRRTAHLPCLLAIASFAIPTLQAYSQETVFLSHRDHVVRAAMDLMGARPSQEDLNSSPGEFDSILDRYMTTEAFNKTMMWLANDIFMTRTDFVEYFQDSYDYDERRIRYQVAKAVGEEQLRLFEYIVKHDLPLTELVTADYTVANSTLAFFWNIDYPGEYYSDVWSRGRYLDGRPHAGALSQTSFYYRYPDTFTNKNRHRANNITRIFLGDDHLLRNVGAELRVADPDQDLLDATRMNPACLACHSSMDGIGAHVNGFNIGPDRHSTYSRENFTHYSLQDIERTELVLRRKTIYYGYPSNDLTDLGNYIAKDPRFARTMARHFMKFLLHRDLDYRDRDLVTEVAAVLKSNNFSPKALVKAIVHLDEYRAVGLTGGTAKAKERESKEAPVSVRDLPPIKQWLEFDKTLQKSNLDPDKKKEWKRLAQHHASAAATSLKRAGVAAAYDKGAGKGVEPLPLSERAQPFKVVTPEQLHFLGIDLLGEEWAGSEGGQSNAETFPHLEYNTGVKVAMGGYDGGLILERRWSVTPTFMLVLERWAEVMAEDIYNRELRQSLPWSERRVFKVITGKEEPREAEPSIKLQISNWFLRFYGQQVDPFGPEVQEVFDLLLNFSGRDREEEEGKTQSGGYNTDLRVAWQHVLEILLCDPRVATY